VGAGATEDVERRGVQRQDVAGVRAHEQLVAGRVEGDGRCPGDGASEHDDARLEIPRGSPSSSPVTTPGPVAVALRRAVGALAPRLEGRIADGHGPRSLVARTSWPANRTMPPAIAYFARCGWVHS